MKPHEQDEELMHRWIDNDLSEDERQALEARFADDPGLRDHAESLRQVGEFLRESSAAPEEPPSPDFFNSQLRQKIEAEEFGGAKEPAAPCRESSPGWFRWFSVPWAVAAAAVALTLFVLTRNATDHGPGDGIDRTLVTSTYAPGSGVQAETFYSEEAGATVILLEGLQEIPDEQSLTAHRAVSYEHNLMAGAHYLYGESGDLLLVMTGGEGRRLGFLEPNHGRNP